MTDGDLRPRHPPSSQDPDSLDNWREKIKEGGDPIGEEEKEVQGGQHDDTPCYFAIIVVIIVRLLDPTHCQGRIQ